MRLRLATPSEAPALSALVQRAYGGYVDRIGVRPAPMDDDYEAAIAQGVVTVAEQDRSIVGLIVLRDQGDHLLIENVAVEPAHQHAGIGRALMDHAERVAREHGRRELRLYTNAAMERNLRLYPRLGYRETGRRQAAQFDRVYFAKRVADADDGRGGDGEPPPHADPTSTAW